MLKLQLTILVIIVNSTFALAQYLSVDVDGIERTYLLHLPENYSESTNLPLIIAMHGGFGDAYNLERQSQLSVKADAERFIVVYPEGLLGGILNIRTWNAGVCCGASSRDNIDDVGFINKLIDKLISKYKIDSTRIYATGMSNGGFMSYRLACELSNRIAAIAPVACTMTMDNYTPTRAVPIIHFHSYIDESIPYQGGIGNGVSDHYNPPLDSVLNAWASSNSCSTLNDTIIDNSQYTFIKWNNCDCNTEIQQYITHDGGHSWPGGKQTAIGDPVSEYIKATDIMWEFLKQYSLNCETRTTIKEFNRYHFQLFPNPSNNLICIELNESYNSKIRVTLLDSSGKKKYSDVIEKGKLSYQIDLSGYINGVYLLQLKSTEISLCRKIIKQ